MAATSRQLCALVAALPGLLYATAAGAAVLPEDRADMLIHYYEGGGVRVRGPALLLRKGFAEQVSFAASYNVDTISSASIDVVTTASPYSERREERGLTLDYLYRDTVMSLSFTNSEESDYVADTTSLDVTQEVFGGMTTVSLGYSRGSDTVGRSDDPNFDQPVDRWQYRLGVTQVLTETMLVSLNYEAISDEGFLSNPYRAAYVSGTTVPERYPATRSTHAAALRLMKYIEPRSAARVEYRYFWDTWEIKADTIELGYSRYFDDRWLGEIYLRHYAQSAASFYSDNFAVEMNYMARDKELSTFKSLGLGVKLSYRLRPEELMLFDKVTLNAAVERVQFEYDDFTDVRSGELYSFDANVVQLYVSMWF